jgi:uncharacterized protein YjbI with pentapeptide repeats
VIAFGHAAILPLLAKARKVTYLSGMSTRGTCSAPNCRHRSYADTVHCLHHLPDNQAIEAHYVEYINHEPVLRNLVVPLMSLDGLDFSHKTLIDCDFHGAIFNNCTFSETNFTFCLFDHAVFTQCRFHENKILESVFACGRFQNTDFSVSDIIQCNFNGSQTINTRFMACDLMYSRFLSIQGEGLLFEDCNLKGVYFRLPAPDWMTFTYSNREDAIYI